MSRLFSLGLAFCVVGNVAVEKRFDAREQIMHTWSIREIDTVFEIFVELFW